MKKALFQRALCLLLTLSTLLTGLGFTASAGSLKDADLEEGEESIYTTLEEMQALIGTSSYSEYIDDYVWELNNQTGLIAPTIDLIGGMYVDVSSGVVVSQSELCDKVAISEAFLSNPNTSADTSVYLPSQGYTTWNFHVSAEQAGLYYIKFTYFTANTAESSISTIERKLKIDGKIPYDEVASLAFTKEWKFNNKEVTVEDTTEPDGYKSWYEYPNPNVSGSLYKKYTVTVKDGKKTTTVYTLAQDINGNTMSAETVQEPSWNTYYCQDSTGYEQGYLLFYLEEGERSITLEAEREPVILSAIELIPYDKNSSEIPSYAEILQSYQDKGYTTPEGGSIVDIQAEFPDYVSDASVSVSNDNTSAVTTPVSSQAQQFNVIGETGYNTVGQWAAYKFSVNKSGLYNFSMRFKQNALEGMYICRTLKISGGHYGQSATIPFAEAYNAQFNYSKDWQSAYVSDQSGEAFQFYFEAGVEYTIYLECSLGSLKTLIKRVEDVLNGANSSYLRILQYTGPSPDKARQYNFDLIMMDVLVGFMDQARELMAVKSELEALCGGTTGAHTATLETVAILLDTMGRNKGEKIAENMSNLKSYLGTLGTWINNSKRSSMMVDSIYVVPAGTGNDGLAKAEAGFFKSVWFEFLSFIFSFFTDYEAMGLTKEIDENTPKIDVWLASGRDQSQIWRSMIDANDGFTNTTGTAASLKLVTGGTLLPSILSGKGPDVYIGLGSADVINYAIRDAVVSISGNAKAETEEQKQANSYFSETYYTYKDSDGNYENSNVYDPGRADQITFISKPYSEVTTPDEYSPAAMKTITLLGESYGLPTTMGFAMMFYRMDSLANLGLEIPESWGQLLAALPVLQTNNMAIGVTYISALDFMIYQKGGSFWKYTDETKYSPDYAGAKVDLDSNVALEAFEFTCRLYSDYSFPISFDAANRFRTGEMPIVIGDYASIYNTLVVFATEIDGLWEFCSLPGSTDKDGNFNYLSLAGVSATVMLHGCDNPLAAWQFIQWQGSAEIQANYGNKMVALIGPSAKYETANLKALKNLSWTASEYAAIQDQVEHLDAIVNYPGSYIIGRYLKFAFLDAVNDGAIPTDALKNYIDAINSEIERKREEFKLPTVGNGDAPMLDSTTE